MMMMSDDFGVPMQEAELSKFKNPGKVILHEQLATSGQEMQLIPAIIGAVVAGGATAALGYTAVAGTAALVGAGIGASFAGAQKSASAARQQAEAANDASERQFHYNTEQWYMKKEQLEADREYAVAELETKARNDAAALDYQDLINQKKYAYDLQIRDLEQASLDAQFDRSNQVYDDQLHYNKLARDAGINTEILNLQGKSAERRFDSEELYLQMLTDDAELRSLGQSGRSADKASYSVYAKTGKRLAALEAAMNTGELASRAVIEEIERDYRTADLAAFAQKMLDPGQLPDVIEPMDVPRTEWLMPRDLEEFDFGPKPVMGAQYNPNAAAQRVWGSAITSMAGSIPSYVGMF